MASHLPICPWLYLHPMAQCFQGTRTRGEVAGILHCFAWAVVIYRGTEMAATQQSKPSCRRCNGWHSWYRHS